MILLALGIIIGFLTALSVVIGSSIYAREINSIVKKTKETIATPEKAELLTPDADQDKFLEKLLYEDTD